MDPRAVVLVEGVSDQVALETLAERRGRDLAAEQISIVPIGGAQAIGGFLERYGPQGLDVRLAGLCDAGEERDFRRGLERAGLGSNLDRDAMEVLGPRRRADPCARRRSRGANRRGSARARRVPHSAEAAGVAR
jgi:hypothetical protein